jgi:hypothetical protein
MIPLLSIDLMNISVPKYRRKMVREAENLLLIPIRTKEIILDFLSLPYLCMR